MKNDQNRSSECQSAIANESQQWISECWSAIANKPQQWLSLCALRLHHDVYHLGCPSWGGEMAQLLKCFLCKHGDVSSTPRAMWKKPRCCGVLVIPALGRQTLVDHRSLLASQPSLLSEHYAWEKAWLSKQTKKTRTKRSKVAGYEEWHRKLASGEASPSLSSGYSWSISSSVGSWLAQVSTWLKCLCSHSSEDVLVV